jgi:hypothetical protein
MKPPAWVVRTVACVVAYLAVALLVAAWHSSRLCRADMEHNGEKYLFESKYHAIFIGVVWPLTLPFLLLDVVVEHSNPQLDRCAT